MQLIELKLDGKLLHFAGRRQAFDVVANNEDYCVKVTFVDPRPNAVGVIFEMFGEAYTVLLDENNEAAVPDGVLIGGRKLRVGLSWGEDLDVEHMTGTMTSTDVEVLVRYSIRSRLRDTPLAAPNNSDFLTQITALVNGIKNVDSVEIDDNGHLILTLTNGTTQDCGAVNDWDTLQNRPFGDFIIEAEPVEFPADTTGVKHFSYTAKINGKNVTVTLYKAGDYLTPDEVDGATLYYSINGVAHTLTIDKTALSISGEDWKSVWVDDEEDGGANDWPGYRLVLFEPYVSVYGLLSFRDCPNDTYIVNLPTISKGIYFASYSSNDETVQVTKLQPAPEIITVKVPERYLPDTALPAVTAADNGKIPQVKNGSWNVQHPELGEETIHFLTNTEIEALFNNN